MDWFKALQVGAAVVMGLLDASKDGKITVDEILKIGMSAAVALGYDVTKEGIKVDLPEG